MYMLTAHSVESTCTPRAPPHFLLEPKGDDAAVGGVSRCLQSPRCAEESSVRRCAQTGRTGPVVKRQFNVKPGRHSERKQVSLSFSLNRSFENIQELFFTSSYLLITRIIRLILITEQEIFLLEINYDTVNHTN